MSQSEPESDKFSIIPKFRMFKLKKIMLKYKKTRDKIVFCLNFITLLAAIVIALTKPMYYPLFNAFTVLIMLAHRVYEFSLYKWEFYLIDFCYLINLIVIAFSLYFKKSLTLFLISFGFSMGPIFFAIFVFRHAYVFHNTVKFTSLWTHTSPPLTMFLIRWFDYDQVYIGTEILNSQPFDIYFLLKYAISLSSIYVIWAAIYYVLQFKVCSTYIKTNRCETQFDYTYSKGGIGRKQILVFGEMHKEIGFMYLHMKWVMLTSSVSLIFFMSYYIGLIVVVVFHLVPVYFASTYYIDYFSENYLKQFKGISEGELPVPV